MTSPFEHELGRLISFCHEKVGARRGDRVIRSQQGFCMVSLQRNVWVWWFGPVRIQYTIARYSLMTSRFQTFSIFIRVLYARYGNNVHYLSWGHASTKQSEIKLVSDTLPDPWQWSRFPTASLFKLVEELFQVELIFLHITQWGSRGNFHSFCS